MESIQHSFGRSYRFLTIALALFLLGALTKLATPLAEWDYVSIDAASKWAQGINQAWIFDHPPLYPAFLSILFKCFGSSVVVVRLGNALSILLAAFILFHTAKILFQKDAAIWATILYLISPVCIQGVITMDVADTSLLPLAFVFTIYTIIRNTLSPCFKNSALVAVGVSLCFWAKVTSSIALVSALLGGVLILLMLEKHRTSRSWHVNLYGIIAGVLVFLISWVTISLSLWGKEAFMAVFLAPGASLFSGQGELDVPLIAMQLIRHTLIIMIWFSPYFVLTWLYSSWKLSGRNGTGSDQDKVVLLLIGVTLFYFIGYTLVGGTNWGFPRYHNAILPLLCLFSGVTVSRYIGEMNRKSYFIFSIALGFSIIFILFWTNDPLYFFIFQMKEMLLFSAEDMGSLAVRALALFLPLYGLPIVMGVFVAYYTKWPKRRRIFITCLLLGSFSSIISLNIQQIHASYRTSTEYGAIGKDEVIERVKEHVQPDDYVLATPQFTYELRNQKIFSSGLKTWQSREQVFGFIEHNRPSVIIAGLTVNTYEQLNWLISEKDQNILEEKYVLERIGTYFLWLRKE